MKVLITGGAGYIGSVLSAHLIDEGHTVRALDRLSFGDQGIHSLLGHSGFELVRGDIRDPHLCAHAMKDIDAVVHLAAIVGDPACAAQPEDARAINLEATKSLVDIAQSEGVSHFLFASTCSNYGRMSDPNSFVDETSQLNPVSLYAETKVSSEAYVVKSGLAHPIGLRFATVYGLSPRMRFDLTVNEFSMEMLTKKKLLIFGEQFWRPYVHVFDIARAIQFLLTQPGTKTKGEIFNIGNTKENYKKGQLAELIRKELRSPVSIEKVEKKEDPRDYRVSFEKLAKLGFETKFTVPDGIREVLKAIEDGQFSDLESPLFRNIQAA